TVTRLDEAAADALLQRCNGEVKVAIVAHLCAVPADEARAKLTAAGGRVGLGIGSAGRPKPVAGTVAARPVRPDLVLGVDGGGTNTVALLARRDTGEAIGRGAAGPSS